MLPEIGFNGGTTIICAPEFNVSLNCGPTSHGWNRKVTKTDINYRGASNGCAPK
jgi:hypothetical protein